MACPVILHRQDSSQLHHMVLGIASDASLRLAKVVSPTPKRCSQAIPKKMHIGFAVDNEETDLANILEADFAEYQVKLLPLTRCALLLHWLEEVFSVAYTHLQSTNKFHFAGHLSPLPGLHPAAQASSQRARHDQGLPFQLSIFRYPHRHMPSWQIYCLHMVAYRNKQDSQAFLSTPCMCIADLHPLSSTPSLFTGQVLKACKCSFGHLVDE